MEKITKKCSLESHKENDSILFCYNCKIYMCNKCEKHHTELFPNHHQCKLEKDKDINEIFTGLCKENNHPVELKYFCITHNKLCCSECITKFKGKNHGQHTDCKVCAIEDIEEEKKNKLNENFKNLENLSINLEKSINELKIFFEKIEKNKEELKIKIQNIFTKLRNALNDKEDEMLLEVDKKFNELYFNEDIFKEIEKFPNKIKISLEKGKLINENWKDNKLNSLINDCLNIENNIKEINKINLIFNKFNSNNNTIDFYDNEDESNQILEIINTFRIIDVPLSTIIKNKDFAKINEWIGGNNKFILKYSAKRDGCNTDIFHEKCDSINGAVFICKVDGGDIIGGYLSAKIQKKNEFSDDNKAFIFNLTKNMIRKNKKSYKNAILNFSDSSYFIRFGSGCKVLVISGNCLNGNNSSSETCSCEANFDSQKTNIFNISGKTSFKVENFEVFQVI